MHEASLARGILSAVLDLVGPGDRIRVIRGWLAETEALDPLSIRMHFLGMARGTAAEGAKLELMLTHVAARCLDCAKEYLPEHHLTLCPDCGSTDANLVGEVGLGIEDIDVASG